MKKLIGSIALMAIMFTGFAQIRVNYSRNNMRPKNALVIDTRGQRDFTVVVDNGAQYQSSGGAVTINSLSNGTHRIMVYETRKGFLRIGKNKQSPVFNSTIRLKPGIETSVFVNRSGQPEINEKALYNSGRGYNQGAIRNR